MSEPILKALMQLFALIIDLYEDKEISARKKNIIRSFLSRQLNNELVERYLKIFDEYLDLYHRDDITKDSIKDRKRTSLTAMRILGICEKINEELQQKQKIYVIIQLIEFISFEEDISERELDFLMSVASAFNIMETEYQNIRSFILESVNDISEKSRVLIIDNKKKCKYQNVKHIYNENLSGEIFLLNIVSTNTYILRYLGDDDLYLNGQNIISGRIYIFDHGSSIRSSSINTVYYTDVAGIFSEARFEDKISITANDVVFRFKNSENGIQKFNLHEVSGKLVGIMGGSGVGKSTLLNVLNGNLKPQGGEILINGYNLNNDKEKSKLKGIIGFVPQEDLLIEELTVYQNLFYNARLCLNNFSEKKIKDVVNNVLVDLDLDEIKDLKVGKPLKKIISGGQRKRLNIGLELIREPSVLFVDEPTSGLSSVDSEVIMNLLKEQTYKGKLVIVNIHQPSSDLYKMFDKILIMDKGGYQIYYGNPTEAVVYFKTMSNHVNANEDQCIKCGNVNPDQVLQIIEAKIVNEHGKLTRTRKVTPKDWFSLFKKNIELKHSANSLKEKLPENYYSIPGLFKQSKIFFIRDLLSKLANKQYILISLLEAPLLALILGYFTKYISGIPGNPDAYIFSNNENIPAYLFMSVVVSLFLGLVISSEEIIKDRKILQRESFLNLSRFSYLNSKILILFTLSAIQTISYVLIGNFVLGIKGMALSYWLVLFTTSCFANMLGLNISSGFSSIITIYILIPFLLIPQLLFSGVIVKFDKLHKNLTSYEFVPVIGDLMTSRWAFEALAVNQFKNNKFEKNFFDFDKEISNARYIDLLVQQLVIRVNESERYIKLGENKDQIMSNLKLIRNEILSSQKNYDWPYFDQIDKITIELFDIAVADNVLIYLKGVKRKFLNVEREINRLRDERYYNYLTQLGGNEAIIKLKTEFVNKKLSDQLMNNMELIKTVESKGHIIRKFQPIFMDPTSKMGRAHFYSPVKIVWKYIIETFWFNIIFIWFTSLILFMVLYFDLLSKSVTYFENIRLRKSDIG